jgi:4-hydroxy-tetrahydrodipicolinate synthase
MPERLARLSESRLTGVYAAVLTPVTAALAPDHDLLGRHCRWLLGQGCDGLSVLGTTGEANSFSVDERIAIIEALLAAGVPAARLLPGTGCCALPDTVRLTAHAVGAGAGGVLMLPPFYYKGVSDDGLFAAYAEIIERVGDSRLRVYLYHFPQLSGVPLSLALIERLAARYPATVVGLKDSSGDLAGMIAAVQAIPGFAVLSGSDELLLPLLAAGGAGCITAVCNIASAVAAHVVETFRRGDHDAAEQAQARLSEIRRTILGFPLSAALKAMLAAGSGLQQWRNLRPPLLPLPPEQEAELHEALAQIRYRLPAWR